MGLFSSKKKTTVATSVTRAIEDDLIPNSPVTGLVKGLFQNGDIVEHMLEEMVGSVAHKAERMYRYAEESYTHGLPSGEFHVANQGQAQVEVVLEQLEGRDVIIDYVRYGPPNTLHQGWMHLVNSLNYNPSTNQIGTLSNQKGSPVYLKDMVVHYPGSIESVAEPAVLDQWGPSPKGGQLPSSVQVNPLSVRGVMTHTPVQFNPGITTEQVRITYVWEAQVQVTTIKVDGVNVPLYEAQLKEESLTIPIAGKDIDKDYFHAKYRVGNQTKYWMYEAGAGTYPVLDTYFNSLPTENGSFFPFIYFRYDKQPENLDKAADTYKSSRKMLKYLGMDFDQLVEAINENPDIEDVEQAMLVMAVPAKSEDPTELRYLYDFFETWYGNTGKFNSELQANLWASFNENDPEKAKNILVIQDKRFKMALSNNGIFRSYVVGDIGPIGTIVGGYEDKTYTETVTSYFDGMEYEQTYTFPVKYHYYRKQVMDGVYLELKVKDLRLVYYVEGKYAVTADAEEDILLIPIDKSITSEYEFKDREVLYTRALHYVFNSLVITKIKWYQTGIFKALLVIVAIVITVWTQLPTFEVLFAALAAGNTAVVIAMITVLVQNFVIGMAISAALKLFVKAVGVEVAVILAVIAAATGYVQAFQNGGIKGLPWADRLIQVANGLIESAQSTMEDLMKDLQLEFDAFTEYKEEQTNLLDQASKLLEGNNLVSPMIFFGETPEDFYNRTVHSGNVGVIGIDAISNYVDFSLRLPKIHETVEGFNL